jgi:hypothetical protein
MEVEVLAMTNAAFPPISTDSGMLSPVPVIVTSVPTEPWAGKNELIVGAWAFESVKDKNTHRKTKLVIKLFIFYILSVTE